MTETARPTHRVGRAVSRTATICVRLFIGVPTYQDQRLTHQRRAETVAAAIRGVRLAIGDETPRRDFGVAIYVDSTATVGDWATYQRDWAARSQAR